MNKKNKLNRFFAVVLVVGGVVGNLIAVLLAIQIFKQSGPVAILAFILAIPFTWAAYTGVRLWQGTSYGCKWAPIVYASQIPLIRIPNIIEYQWFTGLVISPIVTFIEGDTYFNFHLNFGANAQFSIGTESTGFMIGCNLFAVAALVLITRSNRSVENPTDAPDN